MGQLSDSFTPLTSFACWNVFYFIVCLLDRKRHFTWHYHTLVLVHAIVAVVLSAYSVFILGPWPFTNAVGDNTEFQQFVLAVSLGYFILDLIYSAIFIQDPLMLIHHVACVFFTSASYFTGRIGTGLIMMLFLAELTNPFLQIRWFLRATNKPQSIQLTNEFAYAVLFAIARLVVMPYFTYRYFQQDSDLLGRIGAVVLVFVGFGMWFQLMQLGLYKYRSLQNNKSST